MTSADVRDMLDLPTGDGHPRPAKKQKTVEKRPEGITRELFALLGERAPPVAITDHIKYKERPKSRHKAQRWVMTAFTNPAREDGLVLRHWRRAPDPNTTGLPPATPASTETPGGANGLSETSQDSKATQTEADYHFAKFNVKVEAPEYDDNQYEAYLKSDQWSREESDYLISMAKDYDLRWIVIADRYDYQPNKTLAEEQSNTIVKPRKPRTMEGLKARYYEIAAKTMALHHPISTMSATEFDLHEKMIKFDPRQEATRKQLAEALLSRSSEEIKDEEILLGELKRIVTNEERFSQERRELYARLEAPQSSGNTAMYQSSQGLAQLMQTLLSADKNKKRRSLLGPNEGGASSPAGGGSQQNLSTQADRSHRDSLLSNSSIKKATASSSSATQRQLTPREELKFGVSHHERLTSGVQFRHERITKLAQAKSNVQATKISAALAELQIPARLVMPTAKVVAEYERLIGCIHTLLDVRKVAEKVEGEIRVMRAQREMVADEVGEEENGTENEIEIEDEVDEDEDEEDDVDDDDDDQASLDAAQVQDQDKPSSDDDRDDDLDGADAVLTAAGTAAVAPRSRSAGGSGGAAAAVKRSASVLSGGSEKSVKRVRK
ncbi:MAG: DNA methyltransferase 1-associated DMAP1 [Lasallia pustulata]|uniref:SWR1-complex protein 4 n=1 Tax=Lasallia pustulata TaxID=136370 RepID=A0A5M8PLD4_9LECA|nr:MAG: DNA methyltransferase 1-associated DMAP1 [Lasallia pustulata]